MERLAPAQKSRLRMAICAGALILVAFHPPSGLGVPLCWSIWLTGVPCPGCGLLRSMSCSLHGDISSACEHHPFGPLVLLILFGTAAAGFAPWIRFDGPLWRAARWLFVCGFIGYGLYRGLLS